MFTVFNDNDAIEFLCDLLGILWRSPCYKRYTRPGVMK